MNGSFEPIFARIRIAVGKTVEDIEDPARRPYLDATLQSRGWNPKPQELDARTVAIGLAQVMTKQALAGGKLGEYEILYQHMPNLQKIRDELLSQELYERVQIPPTPCVIEDGRMPIDTFWRLINERVFTSGDPSRGE
jgi:hypothetical protein